MCFVVKGLHTNDGKGVNEGMIKVEEREKIKKRNRNRRVGNYSECVEGMSRRLWIFAEMLANPLDDSIEFLINL